MASSVHVGLFPRVVRGRQYVNFYPLVLAFLVFANILDMGGALGIKYLSFICAIGFVFFRFRLLKLRKLDFIFFFFLFILWPMWSFAKGIYGGAEFSIALGQITPFFCGIIFWCVIISEKEEYLKPIRYIYNSMLILAMLVIVLFLIFYLFGTQLYDSTFYNVFFGPKMGYFGYRLMGTSIVPNIYFKATLFLVPTVIYFWYIGEYIKAGLAFLALILSFSKGGFLIAIIFITLGLFTFTLFSRNIFKRQLIVALLFLLMAGIFSANVFPVWLNDIKDTLQGQSLTFQVRKEHFLSFQYLLENHPEVLLIGQGAGMPMYTIATERYQTNFEIDYMNTIRKFGLLWFLFFTFFVLWVGMKLILFRECESVGIGMALFSMFLSGGTNPVLISPLFLMVLLASYRAIGGFYEGKSERSSFDMERGEVFTAIIR